MIMQHLYKDMYRTCVRDPVAVPRASCEQDDDADCRQCSKQQQQRCVNQTASGPELQLKSPGQKQCRGGCKQAHCVHAVWCAAMALQGVIQQLQHKPCSMAIAFLSAANGASASAARLLLLATDAVFTPQINTLHAHSTHM